MKVLKRLLDILTPVLMNINVFLVIPAILLLLWMVLKLVAFVGIAIVAQLSRHLFYGIFSLTVGFLCLTIAYPFIRIAINASLTLGSLVFRTMDNVLSRLQSPFISFENYLSTSALNQHILGKIICFPFLLIAKTINMLFCIPNETTKAFIKVFNIIKLPALISVAINFMDELHGAISHKEKKDVKAKREELKSFLSNLEDQKLSKDPSFMTFVYNSFIDLLAFEYRCEQYLKDSADQLISYKNKEAIALAQEEETMLNKFDTALNRFSQKAENVINHIIDISTSLLSVLLMPFRSVMTSLFSLCIRLQNLNDMVRYASICLYILLLPLILVTGLDRSIISLPRNASKDSELVDHIKFSIHFYILSELLDKGIILSAFNLIKPITSRALRIATTLVSLPFAIVYKMAEVLGIENKNDRPLVEFILPTVRAIYYFIVDLLWSISSIVNIAPVLLFILLEGIDDLNTKIIKNVNVDTMIPLTLRSCERYCGIILGKIVFFAVYLIMVPIILAFNLISLSLREAIELTVSLLANLKLSHLGADVQLKNEHKKTLRFIFNNKKPIITNQFQLKMAKIHQKIHDSIDIVIDIVQDIVSMLLHPLRSFVTFIMLNILLDGYDKSSIFIQLPKLIGIGCLMPIALMVGSNISEFETIQHRLMGHEIYKAFTSGLIVCTLDLIRPIVKKLANLTLIIATLPLKIINKTIVYIRRLDISIDDPRILKIERKEHNKYTYSKALNSDSDIYPDSDSDSDPDSDPDIYPDIYPDSDPDSNPTVITIRSGN